MITIDIKAALTYLLLTALIVLVIYLIVMTSHFIKTIKKTNKILEDATVISGIAADKAVQVDGMIDDVQSAVSDISQAVKGQQNLVGAVSNIVKAVGSFTAIFQKEAGETEPKKKKSK